MPATIRLARMGRKKRPFYRLVVLDSRKRRDGACLANLGYYNPFCDPFEVKLHSEEIMSWLGKGATVSGTARSLLKNEGILYHYSLIKQGLPEAEIATLVEKWREQASTRKQNKVEVATQAKSAKRKEREDREEEAKAAAEKVAAADETETAEEAAPEAEAPAAEEPAEAAAPEAAAPAAEEPAKAEAKTEEPVVEEPAAAPKDEEGK